MPIIWTVCMMMTQRLGQDKLNQMKCWPMNSKNNYIMRSQYLMMTSRRKMHSVLLLFGVSVSQIIQVQTPTPVQAESPKGKNDRYGVFCLTYDLRAEEETNSWKKLINIAVSGAAWMISNHLLFNLHLVMCLDQISLSL